MAIRKRTIFLIVVAVAFLGLVLLLRLAPRLSDGTVLSIRLTGKISEESPSDLGSSWFGGTEVRTLRGLLEAVERAKTDSRIAGVSVEIYEGLNFAMTQELRRALQDFSDSGKFCSIYLNDVFTLEYYLATACPDIYLTPSSGFYLSGLMASQTFYRGFLDNLGIYPDMHSIAEYKTARNVYTEKRFTRAHRTMLKAILTGLQSQIAEAIAEGRGLSQSEVRSVLRGGPYLAEEAVQRGLVSELLYYDEYVDRLRVRAGTDSLVTVAPGRYMASSSAPSGPRIAIVYATGLIVTGESGDNAFTGRLMGADTIRRALQEAREDSSIKAIILRVNSPGGSPLASEIIRREVRLAREQKPVVVSMSDLAASGGYWIAMSGDRILADPGTLTGSIGVVYGKLNIKGLYEKLGFTKDHIALTPNATFFYPHENFTAAQQQQVRKLMSDIYRKFIEGVAEGREMSVEEVDKIGRGRVWLGSEAVELGLVDELGGLAESIAAAKLLAEIPESQPVTKIILPRPKSRWELLENMFSASTRSPGPFEDLLEFEGLALFREPGWVLMPVQPEIR